MALLEGVPRDVSGDRSAERRRAIADLLTHAAAAAVLGTVAPRRAERLLIYGGAILPDVCFRAATLGLQTPLWFAEPTHSLWGAVLVSYVAASFFEASFRRRAFVAILAGYLSHVAVDAAKDNLGMGAALLLFPVMRLYEGGLYPPEASVGWMPAALGVVLAVEAWHAWRARATRGPGAGVTAGR